MKILSSIEIKYVIEELQFLLDSKVNQIIDNFKNKKELKNIKIENKAIILEIK